MRPLRVQFVGGTGIISTACVAEALAQGHEVHLLNRGASGIRPVPEGAIVHIGDIRDESVPAVVLRADLEQSLMGMSYLSRFARVSIEGNRLILER